MKQLTADQQELQKLEKFQARLNTPPIEQEVRTNKHAANSLYLPISYVEMGLDEMFFGLWETKDFRWQVMVNEVVGVITLRVFHPVSKQWIERTGASAVMIRQRRDSGVTNVENKIHNALEMDFPHLKADCIVNAAKSFGKMFGRDLNRAFTDVYRGIITEHAEQNGAITQNVEDNQRLSKALLNANLMLESARMDDQTEQGILLDLSNCENEFDVYRIMDIIKEYLPEPDPKKQLENMNL